MKKFYTYSKEEISSRVACNAGCGGGNRKRICTYGAMSVKKRATSDGVEVVVLTWEEHTEGGVLLQEARERISAGTFSSVYRELTEAEVEGLGGPPVDLDRDWSLLAGAPPLHLLARGAPESTSLSKILPLFQATRKELVADSFADDRAAAQYHIVTGTLLGLHEIHTVKTAGEVFTTRAPALLAKAARLRRVEDNFKRMALLRKQDKPLRFGMAVLWPWQAALAAYVRLASTSPREALVSTVFTRQIGIQGVHAFEHNVVICVAGAGYGKTLAACASIPPGAWTFIVTVPGNTRDWVPELSRVGISPVVVIKNSAHFVKLVEEEKTEGVWVIKENIMKVLERYKTDEGPGPLDRKPDFLVADEVHRAKCLSLVKRFPDLPTLGLTATLTPEGAQSVGEALGYNNERMPVAAQVAALVVRVPREVMRGWPPPVSFHYVGVALRKCEMDALHLRMNTVGSDFRTLHQSLICPSLVDVEGLTYNQQLCTQTARMLNDVMLDSIKKLVGVVLSALKKEETTEIIKARVEEKLLAKVLEGVAKGPEQQTVSPARTEKRLERIWESRSKAVQGYTHLAKTLAELPPGTYRECPVCMSDECCDFVFTSCGHYICAQCYAEFRARQPGLLTKCSLCRQHIASWTVHPDVAEPIDYDIGSKLRWLVDYLRVNVKLGERVVVFCPDREVVKSEDQKRQTKYDIMERCKKEMSSYCTVASLENRAEQDSKISSWRNGNYEVLLAPQGLEGANLQLAGTAIFLTPFIQESEFIQSFSRVVRQGSVATDRPEGVRLYVLYARNTVEEAHLTEKGQWTTLVDEVKKYTKVVDEVHDLIEPPV